MTAPAATAGRAVASVVTEAGSPCHALSGSDDKTVRVWDLATGTCEGVLEGHTGTVACVAYHPDGTVVSAAHNGVLRIWTSARPAVATTRGPTRRAAGPGGPAAEETAQVTYSNAKVVLVGESQAGKSGLAVRLAQGCWEPSESTIGAWASRFLVPAEAEAEVDREIWLWDFGGQADQRLVHQLYLGDTALAVLVFDGQRDDVVARLWDWNRALDATAQQFPRMLVAARTDVNPVRLSGAQIEAFRASAGFAAYFETSAKGDVGCDDLRDAIVAAIDWSRIPWRTSPVTFRLLKQEILALRDGGRALTSTKELRDWLPGVVGPFAPEELDAVIGLLAGPGAVMALGFGDYVLLQPELLNSYAQAVIKSLRDDPDERGCILEEHVLQGKLNYPPDLARLGEADERVVLHAIHKQLVERAICLRDEDPAGKRPTTLVFPSYFRRERPDRPTQPQSFMTLRFEGYLEEIYATLVVRLHHTEPFASAELWRNAADFRTVGGKEIGMRLTPRPDGTAELDLHCDVGTPVGDQVLFAEYVCAHLGAGGRDVNRLRSYICPACSTPVENRATAQKRLLEGKPDIGCANCDWRIPLWDEIEKLMASDEIRDRVEAMADASRAVLDNESRERLLVGDVLSTIARAGQIGREITVGDHGIDAEIEFKDDDGRATGTRVYLRLDPGDSHLRHRPDDDTRRFRITEARHADYWADQPAPVMLVVGDSTGSIECMEIGEPLRRRRETGDWPPTEIVFVGARFDVMAVRRWREDALGSS